MSDDDEVLAGLLRRFIANTDNYVSMSGGSDRVDLCLDGNLYDVTDEERALLEALKVEAYGLE